MNIKKHLQIKKEHHYVWQYYLKNWATENKVWFLSKNRKLILDSTKLIAKERNFYIVNEISTSCMNKINKLLQLFPSDLQKIYISLLQHVRILQKLNNSYEDSTIKNKEIDVLFSAFKHNTLEDLHSDFEANVIPILKKLSNKDLSILNYENNLASFTSFIGLQLTRTKSFKSIIMALSKSNPTTWLSMDEIEESWWLISYMFGINIGHSIFSARKTNNYCLIINNSSIPFITGDIPVINAHPSISDEIKILTDDQMDIFYPISPNIAIMINSSNQLPSGINYAQEEFVHKNNILIAKNSQVHIFGKTKESIEPYIKHVGSYIQRLNTEK
ncbi:DUF4238 domain-containing protein [Morganella morganii]|uniref:DUF4238 domain-containing protein n=1 Tax=Morganella morganii TaxID=582 RepID=UPI000699AB7D|nr:DUF4238 domain-containing protein [Morganella morganii]HDS6844328.1 DUF4238 domain-containing protein [Morganella morganii subsp. morganii]